MRWIFFPPVISFVFLVISAALHNSAMAAPLPPAVWGITIAAYVCLCALSLVYITRNDSKYVFGTSALTQGLMLSVMSVQFGVTPMSWIGLIVFLIGLLQIFFYATRQSAAVIEYSPSEPDDSAAVFKRADSLFEKLTLPVCYTDNKGVIAGATSSFREAIGAGDDEVEGAVIGDLIPTEGEDAVLESGRWRVTQRKEGSRYYFAMIQAPEAPRAAEGSGSAGILLQDKSTGLYTDEYRKIRGPEEVSRAQRYKRPLSGLLLSLELDAGSGGVTSEQESMLGNAFKVRVQSALRTTDCGFLMSDGRVQVLLPETPQTGAKTLLTRIIALPQDIFDEEIRMAVNPKIRGGMFFYNGTTRMEYGVFSAALEEAFMKKQRNADPGEQAA